MFDVLDIINDATKEANSFENHAAKSLSLEERLLYLQGLALVMNADSEIHEDEKEYIRILIKSFDMDDSMLDAFVEFAQAPDKDTVQAFFKTFRRRQIAQLFLFDALMMSRRDGNGCEREQAVIDKIAEQLEVLKGTYSDIYDLFCHIKNKNWDESALYFSSHLLNPEHFKHLLDYFEVDFDELMEKTGELRKHRLAANINNTLSSVNSDLVEWGSVTNIQGEYQNITMTRCRSGHVTAAVILPWLQSQLDKGVINILNDEVLKADISFGLLKNINIKFNRESLSFELNCLEDAVIKNQELISHFYEINEINEMENLLKRFGAKDVARCQGGALYTLNGAQVSAITEGDDIGDNNHPNAVSRIINDQVEVRWCQHCKGGHGSQSNICDDGDKRFSTFDLNEFATTHGFYLVK